MSSETGQSIEPELEQAGALADGTEVFCSVVQSELVDGDTCAIIPGCGAEAEHYYELQSKLAILGVNSVCAAPVYRLSRHQNRLQAQAAQVVIEYVGEEYGLDVATAYGHSWGGSKLASLLHHGLPGIKLAIFHNTAGIEDVFSNLASHPVSSANHFAHEISNARKHTKDQSIEERKRGILAGLKSLGHVAVVAQHSLVAGHHRKLTEHLSTLPESGITLVGLWPEYDPMFNLHSHEIFHINREMPGSVHTEPQSNPLGVAKELVEIIKLNREIMAQKVLINI